MDPEFNKNHIEGVVMENQEIEYAFRSLWARFKESDQENINLEKIKEWANSKKLNVKKVDFKTVGSFCQTECVVIDAAEGKACLPIMSHMNKESWAQRDAARKKVASEWKKLEWFSPFWVSMGDVQKILGGSLNRSPAEAISNFNYHTSTIYTLSFEAVCIEQIMGSAPCLVDIRPLAREAYLAFYAGYKSASIAALIPAIEGAITRILPPEAQSLSTMGRVDRAVNGAIRCASDVYYEGMWVPDYYKGVEYLFCMDERIFAFETFRRWLNDSFFRNTDEYTGAAQLNRHSFAHGMSPEWQHASLSRLIVAISTIGLIESWWNRENHVSVLFPSISEDSKLLWEQAYLHGSAQMVIKLLEEKHFHQKGRHVPIIPTDDGTLLRKAILMEECIKDLVRPLRAAGWSVEFADCESDLYVKLIAKSDSKTLGVGFLYSCGSDNSLYKELEKDCDFILYRGAPYLQEQFAHGVKKHVGPVTGWLPPKASG
ncbi:hypothetical protein E4195_06135 [Pseudomonas putida]|uniref:hypothetical protein n=1 Tax=Pseudomonas putida TaxID=303 RepID=UPI001074D883|nr:hypothetical protein [Pseudomonas putida]TFW38552.1 hypothetical protein E4195_06135 [Pseudomonas putida]